jgi:hypothetical protein
MAILIWSHIPVDMTLQPALLWVIPNSRCFEHRMEYKDKRKRKRVANQLGRVAAVSMSLHAGPP